MVQREGLLVKGGRPSLPPPLPPDGSRGASATSRETANALADFREKQAKPKEGKVVPFTNNAATA